MRIQTAALYSLIFLSSAAHAQEATRETLPEAMVLALQTNPALLAAGDQAAAAREALPIAWSEALPQISATTAANHIYRSEPNLGFFVRDRSEYWIASINTSWLLFSSGRISASTHQARAQIANAAAEYQRTAQDLLLDVSRAYSTVVFTRSVKESQERALENLIEQLRYVDANVDHGFLTQTDHAQARARVEQARASLTLADAQLVEASETYVRLVGHAPPALEAPLPLTILPPDLPAAVTSANQYSPVILAAAARLDAADAALDLSKASGRARLSLETNNALFEAFESRPGSQQESEDTVALRLSVPLFSGGLTRARTRQQRYIRSGANHTLVDTRRGVQQQVNVAWSNLQSAKANVTASVSRVEAAELAQRGMQREQRAGTRSTIDALNQEQELLAARVDLARAQRDAVVSEFELAAAMGSLATTPSPTPPSEPTPPALAPSSD